MKQYFVYILKCSDQSYYTGVTNNLENRFSEHSNGLNKKAYTYNRRPLQLVYYNDFKDINQAITFEKQVKGWKRNKKEALITGDWVELVRLSNHNKEELSVLRQAQDDNSRQAQDDNSAK